MGKYTEKDLKAQLAKHITKKHLRNLYKESFVKIYGSIKGDKNITHYDVIAEQLVKIHPNKNLEDFFERHIEKIKREPRKNGKIYFTESHNPQKEKEKLLLQKLPLSEKWLARSFLNNKYKYIGEIIDFEIPIYEKSKDGVGRIDLLAYNKNTNSLFMIELKRESSKETMLRAILEISTYYCQIYRDILIREFSDSSYPKTDLKKVVLVFKGSLQHKQYDKSEYIQKLAKKLKVNICLIDNGRIVPHDI